MEQNKSFNSIRSQFSGEHGVFHLSPLRESLRISGLFGLFGFLWIVLSDRLVMSLFSDLQSYATIQTYKGWIFVFVTTVFIFLLIRGRMEIIERDLQNFQEMDRKLGTMEEELRYQAELTRRIVENAPVLLVTWSRGGQIRSVNPYGAMLLGYQPEEMQGNNWADFQVPGQLDYDPAELFESILKTRQTHNDEGWLVTRDGRTLDLLWNSSLLTQGDGEDPLIISIGVDITEKKHWDEELKRNAFYDDLTGLPNRSRFEQTLKEMVAEHRVPFALVYLDLDNFKYINDTLSHQVGDTFLTFLGQCLQETFPAPHMAARLGADEFVLLLQGVENRDQLIAEINRLRRRVGRVWTRFNHEFYVSFSGGASFFPGNALNAADLFKEAELAMYQAKRDGKDQVVLYAPGFQESNQQKVTLARMLEDALNAGEFRLHYQPKIRLATGEVTGLEVLIRWYRQGSRIPPGDFIPLAEETGQIYRIERWVFQEALRFRQVLADRNRVPRELSVNLSGRTLNSAHNFQALEEFLRGMGNLANLTLEVTETAVIQDVEAAVRRLRRLRAMGLRIALDDFGTGYSSLNHLRQLPIDLVKLDRSFVHQLEADGKERRIVRSVLELARDLGYEVVAEGIETGKQLEYLKEYNCDSGQGFLLGKPMGEEQILKWLDARENPDLYEQEETGGQ